MLGILDVVVDSGWFVSKGWQGTAGMEDCGVWARE